MIDFSADGTPPETPLAAAEGTYAATPPSLPAALGAMFHANSTLEPLSRFTERSEYDTSGSFTGMLGRALAVAGEGEAAGMPGLPDMTPTPTPMLSADEANARYAPIGPDGKPAPITDSPIPEGVAQLVGAAKAAEIERNGVIARFENAHSWPINFATNTAAFLADPLNLASSFLPTVGEDAILGRLGAVGITGLTARVLARGGAGAVGGAMAQAPLTALRYALGTQEASDYSLRDAMRDVMFSAAGGAIAQAGFGTLGELIKRRAGGVPIGTPEAEPDQAPQAATVAGADAPTKADAMRAAVAQIADERPVDVQPVFEAARLQRQAPPRPDDIVQFLAGRGGIQDQGGELAALGAGDRVVPFRGRLVNENGATLDYAREAAEEAGYLPKDSSIADLLDAVHETLGGRPVFSDRDTTAALERQEWETGYREPPEDLADPFDPNHLFADQADDQARLYSDGFAAGIPQRAFDADREAIYGRMPGEDEEAIPTEGEPQDELDRRIAEAERQLVLATSDGNVALAPEDIAELERTTAAREQAGAIAQAYDEAASCLAGMA